MFSIQNKTFAYIHMPMARYDQDVHGSKWTKIKTLEI